MRRRPIFTTPLALACALALAGCNATPTPGPVSEYEKTYSGDTKERGE